MHDLIILGGTVVDGTGQPAFTGDVAVTNGRITDVGKDLGPAHRTLKADGLLEALRKPSTEPLKDKTVLRQAQHERKIFNDFNTRPVRPEHVEG